MLAAAVLAAGVATTGRGIGDPKIVVALATIAVVAEVRSVKLTSNLEESISLLPTLFSAVLFGPLAAMVVAAASMIPDFRRPYMKWATYTASRSVTGALTGLAATWAAMLVGEGFARFVLATTLGAITGQALDAMFAAVTLHLRGKERMRDVVGTLAPAIVVSLPLCVPLVAFLAFAYDNISPWTLPLFFIPALAAQRLFVLYQEQRRLTSDLVGVNVRLERANISFAAALVATLDARDRYTAGHSAAVAIYARDIAGRLGLPPDQQQLAHLCGLVHDIGKIGLPAGLLEKPGALTLEERREMEKHSEIGERILSN
ncbi:MAG TPA: HD domain-containing protein, partial [Sphingomicrobium sp.]